MTLPSGTRLGSYELIAILGAGGMGEVYRARDTRLGREVAVKVLPAEISQDADRRARFEQEARSASALNHPNIVTIHGIGTSDGALYIAMEMVEGRTLRELLAGGALPTRKLLPIGAQVADGLAKAHAAGIVHRDLKPENVMVNKDGFVKILDFGLAKLIAPLEAGGSESPTLAVPETRPGVVLGTVGYMSPEQASGESVDFRSDQFSLGSILYEMATGQRAFARKTAVETLSAIIREDPEPIAQANPAAPQPLRWIVERCLAKDPEDRYASTRDLARDLRQTLDHLSETSGEAPAVPKRRQRGRWLWAALALLLLAALSDVMLRLRAAAAMPPAPRLTKITFAAGLEDEPTFSPDGKFLAYTTDERGNLDVVVLPLAGGEPIRVATSDADEAQPAWSPDGSKLAFVSARDHGGRLGVALGIGTLTQFLNTKAGDIFIVPALGGAAVKLVEDAYYPAWSPDGRSIVYCADRGGQWDLWAISADGGAPKRVTNDHNADFQPAWSPDGRWIAYISTESVGAVGGFQLRVVAASGGSPRDLARGDYCIRPVWSSDGRAIVVSLARDGITNLWKVPFRAGEAHSSPPQRVTVGQGADVDAAVSRDGRRLAYATVRSNGDIWELTLEGGALRQVTSETSLEDRPEVSPDGKTLLCESDRGGSLALWTLDLRGRFLSQLGPGIAGRWSPDGERIAFIRTGKLFIQRIGSVAARDTGVRVGTGLSWSPDGKKICFGAPVPDSPNSSVTTYMVETGAVKTVLGGDFRASFTSWSPDGQAICFQNQNGPNREIWIVPAEGGAARRVTSDSEDSHPQWSPRNPDEILFLRDHKRLAIVSIATGQVRFPPGYSEGNFYLDYPTWSPDARRVYFSVYRKSGDVYLLEGF